MDPQMHHLCWYTTPPSAFPPHPLQKTNSDGPSTTSMLWGCFSKLFPPLPIMCAVGEGLLGLDTWTACCRRDFLESPIDQRKEGDALSFLSLAGLWWERQIKHTVLSLSHCFKMCVYIVLKAYFEARKGGSVCYCFRRVKGRKLVGSGKDNFTI